MTATTISGEIAFRRIPARMSSLVVIGLSPSMAPQTKRGMLTDGIDLDFGARLGPNK